MEVYDESGCGTYGGDMSGGEFYNPGGFESLEGGTTEYTPEDVNCEVASIYSIDENGIKIPKFKFNKGMKKKKATPVVRQPAPHTVRRSGGGSWWGLIAFVVSLGVGLLIYFLIK